MSIEYLLLSLISPFLDPGNLITIALGLIILGFQQVTMPQASSRSKPQEKIEVAMPKATVNDSKMVEAFAVSDNVFMAINSDDVGPDTASVVNESSNTILNVDKESVQPYARMNRS